MDKFGLSNIPTCWDDVLFSLDPLVFYEVLFIIFYDLSPILVKPPPLPPSLAGHFTLFACLLYQVAGRICADL
jgi:hypothetical protein